MASLQWSKPGTMDRGSYVNLLSRDFDVIWKRDERRVEALASYVETIQSGGETFKISNVGQSLPLPQKNEDTEGLNFEQPAPGHVKEATLYGYRQAVRITDTMVAADRYSKVKSMAGGLSISPRRKKEYQRANLFNNGFSGTAGADSLALFHDSHTHENNEAGTWDNLGTGALTHGNLQALRLVQQKITNEQGFPCPTMSRDLIIPSDLLQKATELVSATQMPENALNQPNVLIRSLNIVVSHHLTSATAYFLAGDLTGEEKGLIEAELIPLNVKDCKPSDNPDIVWARRSKFVNAVFFTTSKNLAGSDGT
ncbi:MAG: hypothetical protein GY851_00360 [bacterium]|nr:hypothetical protein [bacterium]